MSSHLYACRLLRYHRLKDFNQLRRSMNIKEQVKSQINFQDTQLKYYDMNKLASLLDKDLSVLPFSIRVLLENLIRNYDEKLILEDDIKAIFDWPNNAKIFPKY